MRQRYSTKKKRKKEKKNRNYHKLSFKNSNETSDEKKRGASIAREVNLETDPRASIREKGQGQEEREEGLGGGLNQIQII